MCGGGGGGSASQDALAQEQNLQMQRSNARQQNEDLARQRAIAQINQLYGIDSQVDGTAVEEVAYTPPQVKEVGSMNKFNKLVVNKQQPPLVLLNS